MFDINVLNLDSIKESKARARYRSEFADARPFKHLVFENLFSEVLLDEITDEFKLRRQNDLIRHNNGLEIKVGTRSNPWLGPAGHAYFSAIHSGLFVEFLHDITGIKGLLPDPSLLNGGLHEIPQGGAFVAHIDFNKHTVTHLDNRLVLITYLNRGWQPAYGGGLELWDGDKKCCVKTIQPIFGHSVLLYHSPKSWHGHPVPVNTPDKSTRKSIAAYYYTNGRDDAAVTDTVQLGYNGSVPLWPAQLSVSEKAKNFARLVTPPVIMNWVKNMRDHQRRKSAFEA